MSDITTNGELLTEFMVEPRGQCLDETLSAYAAVCRPSTDGSPSNDSCVTTT